MSYAILRTSKLKDKSKTTSAAEHNFRIRNQGNIDQSKSGENRLLFNPLNVDVSKAGGLTQAITSKYEDLEIKVRANAVFAQEFVITASPEFFENKEKGFIDTWADAQLEFMKQNFGDNVVICMQHNDERTPHLHFVLSTEEKRERTHKSGSKKMAFGLNARRWNPAFLKDLHTKHAEFNQSKGYDLKRGLEGSTATHRPVKEFYRDMERLEAEAGEARTWKSKAGKLSKMVATLADWLAEANPELSDATDRLKAKASVMSGGNPHAPEEMEKKGAGRSPQKL